MTPLKTFHHQRACLRLAALIALLSAGLTPSISPAASGPVEPSQPNFVIIFVDDMGYGDIGPFGATRQRTPHLDRMAREGMRFTSFYAAPVCSVSRAQLLTGCYGARISVPGVYFPAGKNGLNPAEFTVAERLKTHGYATACIGKWHLGDQPEFLPTRQGFDHYFGIPYSNDMQRKPARGGSRVVPLLRDEKVVELLSDEEQSRIVERYTDEALGFIRDKKNAPFLLYLAHTAVHIPIHPGARFAGKSNNGRYGDWVEEVDWSVGRILDGLRELGLDRRTLVLFTSDNGPWLIKGADGGSAGPLRGGKGSTWEGGVRVPAIAWWPGKIQMGAACDTVAATIDVLPTMVALAGGQVPPEPVIDGRDFSALLFGKTSSCPREAHYYFSGYTLQAVRQGSWKLAITPQPEGMGSDVPGDSQGVLPRLYQLDDDIGERTNVAPQHPEIVARLRALAASMNATIGGSHPSARRPAGQVDHPQPLYAMEAPADTSSNKVQPVNLAALKPGDTLNSSAAPQIARHAFTISCTVETAQKDAIILAQGGLVAGYALYLNGGRVAFAVRTGPGSALSEVATSSVLTSPARITASLAADGSLTLAVNDSSPVTAKGPRLIQRQPAENFCVGFDDAQPVTAYTAKAPFKGKITALRVDVF